MKNIFRFLGRVKGAIAVIILLLIVQAYCELSLPNYTSDILNVGLQQSGIENAVLTSVREDSLNVLKVFMTKEEKDLTEESYETADADGIRKLKDTADTDALNQALLVPECAIYMLDHSEESPMSSEMLMQALASGMVTEEQLKAQMEEGMSTIENMTDTYLTQVAVQYVQDEYTAQGIDLEEIRHAYLFKVGALMLLMTLVMIAAAILCGLLAAISSAKIGRSLRADLYKKVMSFTDAEMEKFSTASLITRGTNDIQMLQMVTVMLLRMVLYAPVLAVGGVIMVIQTGSGLGWIIVLAVVILAATVGTLSGIALPKFKKMQTLVDRMNLVSREILTGIMPIRAFAREKHEEERFDQASVDLYKTQLFTNRVMTFMMPIMIFLMNGISVLIVWAGGHAVNEGSMQVGDLTAFITYSMVIVMGFLMMAMVSIILPRAGVGADRIWEVLKMDISLNDPVNSKDAELGEGKGIVKFEHVSFRYPGAEENALEDISFVAEPGKTTAIIGSTGSGKSTLVKLIPRFFDVTEGKITIDGIDIRDLTQKKVRDFLGYVPQKGVLFSGTFESNIKFAGQHISDEDMEFAAEISQAKEIIEAKEEGYATAVAQGGTNVSGGQKQRLAIARAVAKRPKVFIFDDSFSALDYKTDLVLRKALSEKLSDSTIIIVAQRIATILHADQIIVMDDGKVAAIGTHKELLEGCKTYQEIARSQLSEAELQSVKKGGEA